MVIYNSFKNPKLVELIKAGGIGILPTDTIYGLVCSAFDAEAVEKVFEIKGRDEDKPPIILISNVTDLKKFDIIPDKVQAEYLSSWWPGKVSIILPKGEATPSYLLRGHLGLSFRLPDNGQLRSLLQKTGPLIAPSANPQGLAPAKNIEEAMSYFLGEIDFGVDGGQIEGSASTLVDLTGKRPKVLRQGDVEIKY